LLCKTDYKDWRAVPGLAYSDKSVLYAEVDILNTLYKNKPIVFKDLQWCWSSP
jgi:hypothetical protein